MMPRIDVGCSIIPRSAMCVNRITQSANGLKLTESTTWRTSVWPDECMTYGHLCQRLSVRKGDMASILGQPQPSIEPSTDPTIRPTPNPSAYPPSPSCGSQTTSPHTSLHTSGSDRKNTVPLDEPYAKSAPFNKRLPIPIGALPI